ncbi:MAG: type II toxin-antitoxin system VapC family toxin [Flavobacteriales bacterium]|nr:type II toxin-antitoxin system VapC family toxin [Flavobacteriales bacterium]
MRFFLDTNVLFDLYEEERPSHKDSFLLVKQGLMGQVTLVVTAASVMTMLYSLQRYKVPRELVIGRLNMILPHLDIAQVNAPELIAGINSDWNDIEDAIQFHAAMASGGIDAIVSNDKDFAQQKRVPVLTPKQALKRVK